MRKENKPSALGMSDAKKKETIKAVWTAVNIIFQRRKELDAYRREVFSNLEQYSGNFSFTFNMDFMKVSNKLLIGFIQPKYRERKTREGQITIESHKIAQEKGVSYLEVKEAFLSMLNNYIVN